jgi:hypothetical protein
MTFSLKSIFQPAERYEGVRSINIYLLRLLYILMFFVLGKETWRTSSPTKDHGTRPMPWYGASGRRSRLCRA